MKIRCKYPSPASKHIRVGSVRKREAKDISSHHFVEDFSSKNIFVKSETLGFFCSYFIKVLAEIIPKFLSR